MNLIEIEDQLFDLWKEVGNNFMSPGQYKAIDMSFAKLINQVRDASHNYQPSELEGMR